MLVKFRVFNFRHKDNENNYFDAETFKIYGISFISRIHIHAHNLLKINFLLQAPKIKRKSFRPDPRLKDDVCNGITIDDAYYNRLEFNKGHSAPFGKQILNCKMQVCYM